MSVAFTKEQDYEAAAADLADRPISEHPNLVTPQGLAALDAALADARHAYAAAQAAGGIDADRTAIARASRDLRYYSARRASAELVSPSRDGDAVVFGAKVTFEREDGRRQSYRIVGEDEADPKKGSISYVAPIARSLMGKSVGDAAPTPAGEVVVVAIDRTYPAASSGVRK